MAQDISKARPRKDQRKKNTSALVGDTGRGQRAQVRHRSLEAKKATTTSDGHEMRYACGLSGAEICGYNPSLERIYEYVKPVRKTSVCLCFQKAKRPRDIKKQTFRFRFGSMWMFVENLLPASSVRSFHRITTRTPTSQLLSPSQQRW